MKIWLKTSPTHYYHPKAKRYEAYEKLFDKSFDTLEAAVWCLLNTNTYRDALLKAVNLGRDTDTVGAVTGSLAGLYYGVEKIFSNNLTANDLTI